MPRPTVPRPPPSTKNIEIDKAIDTQRERARTESREREKEVTERSQRVERARAPSTISKCAPKQAKTHLVRQLILLPVNQRFAFDLLQVTMPTTTTTTTTKPPNHHPRTPSQGSFFLAAETETAPPNQPQPVATSSRLSGASSRASLAV